MFPNFIVSKFKWITLANVFFSIVNIELNNIYINELDQCVCVCFKLNLLKYLFVNCLRLKVGHNNLCLLLFIFYLLIFFFNFVSNFYWIEHFSLIFIEVKDVWYPCLLNAISGFMHIIKFKVRIMEYFEDAWRGFVRMWTDSNHPSSGWLKLPLVTLSLLLVLKMAFLFNGMLLRTQNLYWQWRRFNIGSRIQVYFWVNDLTPQKKKLLWDISLILI